MSHESQMTPHEHSIKIPSDQHHSKAATIKKLKTPFLTVNSTGRDAGTHHCVLNRALRFKPNAGRHAQSSFFSLFTSAPAAFEINNSPADNWIQLNEQPKNEQFLGALQSRFQHTV